ncbi:MAG: hypothetical protein JOZ07_09470 [Solirubrobacterales bacterium]|nr:hypothetical protein [Solirubrobacterales bacterium]
MLPLAVIISALVIGPARASTIGCPGTFGTFSATNQPSACYRPYASTSPFNRLLPTDPTIAADSGAIISNLVANHVGFEGGGSQFALTTGDTRDGVYYSQDSDPLVTIHCTYYWGPHTCQGSDGVDLNGRQIHIPVGAQPQDDGSDMHLTVVDQSTNTEYDFEGASWQNTSTLQVMSGGETTIGNDLGTGLGSGATAADFATLAGLITEPELASGTINHALSIVLPCTTGSVYPATLANGFPCSEMTNHQAGADAPLGTLFQLNMTDAQIAASGAPNWEKTIMTAMARYGLYVNDTGGNGDPSDIDLEAESDVSYTSLGGQPLLANFIQSQGGTYYAPLNRWILEGPKLDISDFRVIDPCWAQGTCEGSGGTSGTTYPSAPVSTPTSGGPTTVAPIPAPVTPPVGRSASGETRTTTTATSTSGKIPTPSPTRATPPPGRAGRHATRASATTASACRVIRRRRSRRAGRRRASNCTAPATRVRHKPARAV